MPENERTSADTREIPNALQAIARMLRNPPTMQMPKYKTTKRKTNNTIEVARRFISVI